MPHSCNPGDVFAVQCHWSPQQLQPQGSQSTSLHHTTPHSVDYDDRHLGESTIQSTRPCTTDRDFEYELRAAMAQSHRDYQENQVQESSNALQDADCRLSHAVATLSRISCEAYDPHSQIERARAEEMVVTANEARKAALEVASVSIAEQHAECAVCFDSLYTQPCAFFQRRAENCAGKVQRVCPHLMHELCAYSLPQKTCPLCRAAYDNVAIMPSIEEDPDGWFSAVDMKGEGKLSRQQLVDSFVSAFPLNVKSAEGALNAEWTRWDPMESGYVTKDAIFDPRRGLLGFVRNQLLNPRSSDATGTPEIATARLQWFNHFDEEGMGALSQEAVVRGLIKTYGLKTDLARLREMRARVLAIWPLFEDSASGLVSKEVFLRPGDGLADTIIASKNT